MSATPADFNKSLDFVLHEEGGFVDDPRDPGGATNMGITIDTLSAWRGSPASPSDVEALTREEAARIYRARYWDPCLCDMLPGALALVVFDCAVNSGVHRSIIFLQFALGVAGDGTPGPETMAAANRSNVADTVVRAVKERLDFLRALPTWPRFGAGWEDRCNAVRALALSMAL